MMIFIFTFKRREEGKIRENYVYANMRVKCFEVNLLTAQDFEIMFSFNSFNDFATYLKGKGWDVDKSARDLDSVIVKEEQKLWSFVKEAVGDLKDFYFILIKKDVLNLKAIVRSVLSCFDVTNFLDSFAILDPNVLKTVVKDQNFDVLPWYIKDAARDSFDTLLKTNDALVSDAIIDKAMFLELKKISSKSKSLLVKSYVELLLVYACINISLRSVSLKRNTKKFLEKALVETKTFDFKDLLNATLKGKDSLISYLNNAFYLTPFSFVYKEDIDNLNIWFDRCLFDIIEKGRISCFGLDPIFSYVLLKYLEFKKLSLVFSSHKCNKEKLSEIKERLRAL